MKNVIWIILNCICIFHLITTISSIENEDDLIVYLDSSNSSAQETPDVRTLYYTQIL